MKYVANINDIEKTLTYLGGIARARDIQDVIARDFSQGVTPDNYKNKRSYEQTIQRIIEDYCINAAGFDVNSFQPKFERIARGVYRSLTNIKPTPPENLEQILAQGFRPDGKKNWFYLAGVLWPVLILAAKKKERLIYKDLAPILGTNPLSVRYALEPIQEYCVVEELPPLTSLIVDMNTGLPGDGFTAAPIENLEVEQNKVFAFDWYSIPNPFKDLEPSEDIEVIVKKILSNPEKARHYAYVVKSRGILQKIFKDLLHAAYNNQCAFCGLTFKPALEAAHILPYAKATREQRISVQNGLLLCATHHKMFDNDLIGLDRDLKIKFVDRSGRSANSEADRIAGSLLHGKLPYLPSNDLHKPSFEFLQHRKITEA